MMAPKRKESIIEKNLTIRKNPVRAKKGTKDITVVQTVKTVKVPDSKGLPKKPTLVNVEANGKQKTSPETLTETHNWKKLYHTEVERRKKLQTDLLIEKDRDMQMHLQLQTEKNERAKLCQQIGGLQNELSNQKRALPMLKPEAKKIHPTSSSSYQNELISIACHASDYVWEEQPYTDQSHGQYNTQPVYNPTETQSYGQYYNSHNTNYYN